MALRGIVWIGRLFNVADQDLPKLSRFSVSLCNLVLALKRAPLIILYFNSDYASCDFKPVRNEAVSHVSVRLRSCRAASQEFNCTMLTFYRVHIAQ